MILIIYAHPYPHHSHANKRMLEHARTLEGVEVRSLYQLYPDFNIDIAAEQEALSRADLIVWQHPMQWYSIPPLLKLWIDKVFSHGWAYGHGGTALHGKHLLWLYPNELFPTDIRASAVGVIMSLSRIGTIVSTWALPIFINNYGISNTMLMGAGISLFGLLISIAFAPETRGMSLAQTSNMTIRRQRMG